MMLKTCINQDRTDIYNDADRLSPCIDREDIMLLIQVRMMDAYYILQHCITAQYCILREGYSLDTTRVITVSSYVQCALTIAYVYNPQTPMKIE
jgi:hypothetical protein